MFRIAEFILYMGKSSQTEKFRMKTRLDINLGTQIRLRISTDINLRRVKKIKFSFRGTSNTSSFIHLNANLGWVSHLDGIPVQLSCLFRRKIGVRFSDRILVFCLIYIRRVSRLGRVFHLRRLSRLFSAFPEIPDFSGNL